MRRALALALAGSAFAAAAAPAHAGPILDRTAKCLRSQPVCVDRGAESTLDADAAAELTRRIQRRDPGSMFIAILPRSAVNETGGSVDGVVRALHEAVHEPGTYAVVAGSTFAARSDFEQAHAAKAANEVVEEHNGETAQAVLDEFVDQVADNVHGTADAGGGSSSGGIVTLIVLGVILLLVAGLWARRRRATREREREQLEEVGRVARDDLVALGDDIRSLDLDVQMPDADPAAKEDYGRAVDLYTRAEETFDRARRPQDLAPVTEAVEEGRWAIASARARLEGREPPERRPPCFFDPRHGPSVRDVEWTPPWGAARMVPACAADAQRVESGLEPQVREVELAGGRVPYWNAPSYYGPWAGGFFGGFGGGSFLGGLLVGEMLGGGFGWGGPTIIDQDFYSGGGDFGGGDFGGGDFGGGDFGGGDFGGGDFGGGDF